MTLYEHYLKNEFDLKPFGIERGERRSDYFCAPIGTNVIGWTGVDGVHYAFIKGFGEIVFVICPMNGHGHYVYPVARSFEDFISLLISCRGEAAISQAYSWNKEEFNNFIKDSSFDKPLDDAISSLCKVLSLNTISDPFSYIKEVQNSFDYRKIRFSPEYDEWAPPEPRVPAAPEWKVYFRSSFFGHSGRDHAGYEIPINKSFNWGNEIWHVPSVYTCAAGLVVDILAEVEPERVTDFIDRWDLLNRSDRDSFSQEDAERIESEHPLNLEFNCKSTVNEKPMRQSHGCGVSWIPGLSDDLEAKWVLEHYGFDKAKAWSINRICLPWAVKKRPEIKALSISLSQWPISFPAGNFSFINDGESITLMHPLNKKKYILTSLETACDELPESHFQNEEMEYPRKFIRMAYTIFPELDDGSFSIADCEQSDQPKRKSGYKFIPKANNAVMIGIIGGATSVTALSSEPKVRIACSSLHFDKKENIEWRFSFKEKLREDISVNLL